MRVKLSRFWSFLLCFILYALMNVSYLMIEVTEYEYRGFVAVNDLNRILLSAFLFLATTGATFFATRDSMHNALMCLVLVLNLYPSLILYSFHPEFSFEILFGYLMMFVCAYLAKFVRLKIAAPILDPKKYSWFIAIAVIITLLPYFYLYLPHLNFRNLLLIDIYESRYEQIEVSNRYTSYTYSLLTKFLIPSLLIIYIAKKDYLQVAFQSAILLFLFLCGAHKAVLFSLFMIFLFYFGDYDKKVNRFLGLLVSLLLIAQIEYLVSGSVFAEGVFIQRTFFLNSLLDIFYFDFFSDTKLYWSGSFFKSFLSYPYDVEPSYIIGREYFNAPEMQANNGIISDGFINFGSWGVMINVLIFTTILLFVRSLGMSHHFFGIVFILIVTFRNSALSTSLLTHGVILFIVYSQFVLRNSSQKLVDLSRT